MQVLNVAKLLKYLLDDNGFIDIVNAIFLDCIESINADFLCLIQLEVDNSEKIIAACDKNGLSKDIFFEDIDFTINAEIVVKDNYVSVPVFIRNQLAMNVVAIRKAGFDDESVNLLTQISNIIQSIAAKKNFEDSLTNSYQVLSKVLDSITTGVVVLDSEKQDVLLMNRLAIDDISIQSAIGTGLKLYLENGNEKIEEIYEKDTDRWYDIAFSKIKWIDGKIVTLGTATDVTQKVRNKQIAEYQANNDFLTGLYNRMRCERDLKDHIQYALDNKTRGVVLFLDLDDFKQVNDGLGHEYGDVLLQKIAEGIRSIEGIENDCYRMGGDEFVILIRPEVFDKATYIVERICEMFASPWQLMEVEYICTMSMGLAVFPENGTHVQDIIKKADFAMYEAKKGGKNQYKWYESVKTDSSSSTMALEQLIKDEIKNGCPNLRVYYESITDKLGYEVGVECCYDLEIEGTGRIISQEELSGISEYLGLLVQLERYVYERAFEWAGKESGKEAIKLYIRLYPVQLAVKDFEFYIRELAAGFELDNSLIVFCISESAEYRDRRKAENTIEILHAYGFGICMDDFGSGDMSMNKLIKLGTDVVRFDKDFMRLAQRDGKKHAAIKAIQTLAWDLGIKLWCDYSEYGESLGIDYFTE